MQLTLNLIYYIKKWREGNENLKWPQDSITKANISSASATTLPSTKALA